MEKYSTHWRATILAAIAFHCLIALGFSYLLPHLAPSPKTAQIVELEWLDADSLPEDATITAEEAIPAQSVQEAVSTFDAQDLFVPELKIPEPLPEPLPEPPPEVKITERPKLPPPVINDDKESRKKIAEESVPEAPISPKDSKQLMGKPPVTIKEFYPQKGSGLGYKGVVLIAVTIGKDGKVKAANVVQTSGRMFVDEIALKAAAQWTFKPALDQTGRPMPCDKIITFDFKKLAP